MFLMDEDDIKFILMGLKWITMRSIKTNNKGYFKVGSTQLLKLQLFGDWFIRVKILSRSIVDLSSMDEDDFIGVGYDKTTYLNQPYNIQNPSTMRVKYEFEIVEINETPIRELFNGF